MSLLLLLLGDIVIGFDVAWLIVNVNDSAIVMECCQCYGYDIGVLVLLVSVWVVVTVILLLGMMVWLVVLFASCWC